MRCRRPTTYDRSITEETVTRWARFTAAVVALLALVVVVVPGVVHLDLFSDPYEAPTVVTERLTIGPSGETLERTTEPGDDPLIERALAPGGLLLVRLGIAALAAFLAGAVVQRTLLGRFGIKVGGLEVPELEKAAAASDDALSQLAAEVAGQQAAIQRRRRSPPIRPVWWPRSKPGWETVRLR